MDNIEEFLMLENPKVKHYMSFQGSYTLRDEAYVRGINPPKVLPTFGQVISSKSYSVLECMASAIS